MNDLYQSFQSHSTLSIFFKKSDILPKTEAHTTLFHFRNPHDHRASVWTEKYTNIIDKNQTAEIVKYAMILI